MWVTNILMNILKVIIIGSNQRNTREASLNTSLLSLDEIIM